MLGTKDGGALYVIGVGRVRVGRWSRKSPGDASGDSGTFTLRTKPVLDRRNFDGVVDASDADNPVYLNLHHLEVLAAPTDPSTDLGWDLSLARTTLRVNGGVSGAGAGMAYTYEDSMTWEMVDTAPTDGWSTDAEPTSSYSDGTALATWYDYDISTHTVSASGRVHAILDADGHAWKLQVQDWDDGTLTIRVGRLLEAE